MGTKKCPHKIKHFWYYYTCDIFSMTWRIHERNCNIFILCVLFYTLFYSTQKDSLFNAIAMNDV